METKRYIDAVDSAKELGLGTLNERQKLLNFYDMLPTHDDFKRVIKKKFKEVQSRARNTRKRKQLDVSGLNRYASLGTPPPETTSGNSSLL